MSPATLWVRMVSSRWYPPPTRQHDARRLRPSLQREGRRGRVSPGGERIQGVVGHFISAPKGQGARLLLADLAPAAVFSDPSACDRARSPSRSPRHPNPPPSPP